MKTIELAGKNFVIGLEWGTYDSIERAKDVVRDNKEEGFVSGIIPFKATGLQDKTMYLVYKGEKIKGKYYILATAFLHKASGAYYIQLKDNLVWLLVKGTDGAIIFEGLVEKDQIQYKTIEYGMSDAVELSEADIKSPLAYQTSDKRNLYLMLGVVSFLFVGIAFFLISKATKPKNTPFSSSPPQPLPSQPSPSQPPPPQNLAPSSFHANIKKCYGEYYKSMKEIECKELTPAEDYMSCERFREEAQKSGLPFQYGTLKTYDDGVIAYPFSLSGNFYYQQLKAFENWTFAQEGFSLKLSGEPKTLNLAWTGVVLCR